MGARPGPRTRRGPDLRRRTQAAVRSVGLPLMRRYGMKGIVFIVPGRTSSRPGPLAAHPGRRGPGEAAKRRADPAPASESETRSSPGKRSRTSALRALRLPQPQPLPRPRPHRRRSGRLHDARAPKGLRAAGRSLDPRRRGATWLRSEIPLGTPLLPLASPAFGALRFYEDADDPRRLRATRGQQGGEGFFLAKGTGRRSSDASSRRPTRRAAAGDPRGPRGRHSPRADRRKRSSRSAPGGPSIHLCYPWHAIRADRASRGPGGGLPDRFLRQDAGTAHHPGRRRSPRDRAYRRGLRRAACRAGAGDLAQVLRGKLARRLGRAEVVG